MSDLDLFGPEPVTLDDACPVCGRNEFEAYGGLLRCTSCKAVLLKREPTLEGMCFTCGRTNPRGAKFCGHCGAAMGAALAALRFCPRCRQHQLLGYAFCTHCGYNVEQAVGRLSSAACPSCGRAVPEMESFCQHCGSGLHTEAVPPAPEVNPYRHCPACGHPLTPESDLCAACGTDASDYIGMIRALTHTRVAQVVAEEEAGVMRALEAGQKSKRKRDAMWGERAGLSPWSNAATMRVLLVLVLLCIIAAGILIFAMSSPVPR